MINWLLGIIFYTFGVILDTLVSLSNSFSFISASLVLNPGAGGKEKKKKKLTEGQKRWHNRYNYEKERKKREAAAAASLTSSIPAVPERSVVFISTDLPLRTVTTIGPSVAPNQPAPAREPGNPDNQKGLCNNCPSANHFPSEEERARKFIQRRRERESEQAAWQKAIDERRSREAKEREKIKNWKKETRTTWKGDIRATDSEKRKKRALQTEKKKELRRGVKN